LPLRLKNSALIQPSEIARAKELVSDMDLLRLKTVARLHVRGLPADISWEDLLQEAFTRVLSGARAIPPGVEPVAFLAGVMRSLRSEHWRRALQSDAGPPDQDKRQVDLASDPERQLICHEQLTVLVKLFAGDILALGIIEGLAEGLSAEEIRSLTGASKTEYDSARKRIRRTLLKEGLTFEIRE
jgi:RNA polymerase sigma-70 factor (ECF subfamily)